MLPKLDLSSRLAVAPSLVVTNRLLGCNLNELSQRLIVEAANNPILRLLPAPKCPRCGFPLNEDHTCAMCARRPYLPTFLPGGSPDLPDDWETTPSTPDDFRQALLSQARLALDRADHPLAEFIIAGLDEHGLLSGETAKVLPQRAERVLRAIQSLDPPGIAARDTAECFRLQIQRLDSPAPPAIYRLIERWPVLPEHHDALARALSVTRDELDQALVFMRTHLRPWPILASPETPRYQPIDVAMLPARNAPDKIEVIIAPGPGVRAGDDPATLNQADLSPDDRRALVQQGLLLERALDRRRRIMEQVFIEIARQQHAFLLQGPRQHRALTRAQVAGVLEVHASTVGRATAGKSVLIPSGQVIPAALFFERGAAIKYVILEIAAQAAAPLTDEQLRERLAEQGLVIARRTVAKYRAAAGLLPVHMQWGEGSHQNI